MQNEEDYGNEDDINQGQQKTQQWFDSFKTKTNAKGSTDIRTRLHERFRAPSFPPPEVTIMPTNNIIGFHPNQREAAE